MLTSFFAIRCAKQRVPDLWCVRDVALLHLKVDPVFATVIQSIAFEAFGIGIPILITQPDDEATDYYP